VSVPLERIYYFVSVSDSNDACQKKVVVLQEAIKEAKKTIALRDTTISLQDRKITGLEKIDRNNQAIASEYKDELKKSKGDGWIKGVFGALIGAVIMAVVNK